MKDGKSKEAIKKAVSRFREGYVCSEAVLMAFAETYGIKSGIIPRIATGFGGGIGRRGSVCGALTGAVMALSLKLGRDSAGDVDAYEKCVSKSFECYVRFEREFGSVLCRELTGCDLSTPEGRKRFEELGLREGKCVKYVEASMEVLLEIIKGNDERQRRSHNVI